MSRARKYKVLISSFVPPVSRDLFHDVDKVYCLKYLGVYVNDGKMYIYIQFDNRISISNTHNLLLKLGVDVENVSVCSTFEGEEILSEEGYKPKRPGPTYKKIKLEKSDSTIIQPPTNLPEPSSKRASTNTFLDRVYSRLISGPSSPESFHAIWSSCDGMWSPHMWVGPIRNIFPMSRGSIKGEVIEGLLSDQDSKCRLCRTPVFMGTYSNCDVDHIIPLRYGGPCLKSNLQILCVTCHRRKTALECKKIVAIMGEPEIKWEPDKVYITNTHVHFEPDVVRSKNPKAFLEENDLRPGLFVLEY